MAASVGNEGHEYEEVDGEGVVAVSDPTYMEVGAGGGGENKIELKENVWLSQRDVIKLITFHEQQSYCL